MSSTEYLTELRTYLDTLPEAECEAAVTFYKNEFNKGDSETSVMLRLGNPYSLAKRIIAESSDFNDSIIYKNLKKDGMTNAEIFTKTDYKEPEADPIPKIKTAYDKPRTGYTSPPSVRNIKSEKNKKRAITGVFIAVFAAAIFFIAVTAILSATTYHISSDSIEAIAMRDIEASTEIMPVDENIVLSSPVINGISIFATDTDVTIIYGNSYRVEHSGTVDIANYGSETEIIGNGGEITICITDDIDSLNLVMTGGSLRTAVHDISNLTLTLTETELYIIP
jgi:hypothetical protein